MSAHLRDDKHKREITHPLLEAAKTAETCRDRVQFSSVDANCAGRAGKLHSLLFTSRYSALLVMQHIYHTWRTCFSTLREADSGPMPKPPPPPADQCGLKGGADYGGRHPAGCVVYVIISEYPHGHADGILTSVQVLRSPLDRKMELESINEETAKKIFNLE
ncbi:hypothetical protein VTO73DRAFT_13799 [Trametes versicolor]